MIKLLFVLFPLFVLCTRAGAQQPAPPPDSGIHAAVQQAIALSHREAGLQSQLYNGRVHNRYESNMLGVPYYLSNDPQTGSVEFEHILFEQVPLWYDAVKEKLVVQHFNQISAFELSSERVDRFTIGSHRFIRLVRDTLENASTLPTSFYEVLCTGKVTILARRKKLIAEFIDNMEVRHRVDNAETFYALKDGRYHPVNNQRSFFAVLKDRKAEVQHYLHRSKVKFRKNPEAALVQASVYYNQLTPP